MPCPSCHANPKMSLSWGTMERKEDTKKQRWWKPRGWLIRCQHCDARFEVKHNKWVQLVACLGFPIVVNAALKLHADGGVFMLVVVGCAVAIGTAASLTRSYQPVDTGSERFGSDGPR